MSIAALVVQTVVAGQARRDAARPSDWPLATVSMRSTHEQQDSSHPRSVSAMTTVQWYERGDFHESDPIPNEQVPQLAESIRQRGGVITRVWRQGW